MSKLTSNNYRNLFRVIINKTFLIYFLYIDILVKIICKNKLHKNYIEY